MVKKNKARQKARDKGKRWYKSNSVCLNGHVYPMRRTDCGSCRDCQRAKHEKNKPENDNALWIKGKRTITVETISLKEAVDRDWLNLDLKPKVIKVRKRKPTVKKITPHCTCNSDDYRRTLKKTIKDAIAAW